VRLGRIGFDRKPREPSGVTVLGGQGIVVPGQRPFASLSLEQLGFCPVVGPFPMDVSISILLCLPEAQVSKGGVRNCILPVLARTPARQCDYNAKDIGGDRRP
jgi:hypothetical protein